MESQKNPHSKRYSWGGGARKIVLPDFKVHCSAAEAQTVQQPARKQVHIIQNRRERPEINPHIYSQPIYPQGARNTQRKKKNKQTRMTKIVSSDYQCQET